MASRTEQAGRVRVRGRRTRVAEGVYRDSYGLAATVKVNGVQREVRFPPGTSLKTSRARRDELRAAPAGERQLHAWRASRAASTCNHRRHALIHLVRLLCGRRAAFDLLDLVPFRPPPAARGLDRRHIDEVLAQLTPGSKTQAPRAHALDGDATVTDGADGRRGLPARRGDSVRDGPAREGRSRRSGDAGRGRTGGCARLRGRGRLGGWSCSAAAANKAIGIAARNLADVRDLYGHVDETTTRIYAVPTLAKHREAIGRLAQRSINAL